jgi:hypothetical protein
VTMPQPDPDDLAAFDASTEQHVKTTVDALRATAASPEYADLGINQAAARLAETFHSMVDAKVLAAALANVLLDQVRTREDQAAFGPGPWTVVAEPGKGYAIAHEEDDPERRMPLVVAEETQAIVATPYAAELLHQIMTAGHKHGLSVEAMPGGKLNPVKPDYSGVEIRLIGPEPNARRILDVMTLAGIPQQQTSGPLPTDDRDGDGAQRFYTYTDAAAARRKRRPRRERRTRRDGQ